MRVPTEQEEADRQVVRLREQLVRKPRSIQQQIKAFLLQHGIAEPAGPGPLDAAAVATPCGGWSSTPELRFCLDVMLDEREHAREQVARVTRRLERAGARPSATARRSATLRTVPGVGPITAMTFRLELHEPGAVRATAARWPGWSGWPRRSSRAARRRREGRLLKSGNARLRTVLVEAAWRWVAGDEAAKAEYRRLVASTGSGKKAIVGMARRLAILLWRLSVRGEPYRAAA